MTTTIDTMAAAASKRLDLWCARSAGQHKRAVHNNFQQALVSHFYEAGNVTAPIGNIPFVSDINLKATSQWDEEEKPLPWKATAGIAIGMALGIVGWAMAAWLIYAKWRMNFNN